MLQRCKTTCSLQHANCTFHALSKLAKYMYLVKFYVLTVKILNKIFPSEMFEILHFQLKLFYDLPSPFLILQSKMGPLSRIPPSSIDFFNNFMMTSMYDSVLHTFFALSRLNQIGSFFLLFALEHYF